MRLRRRLLAGVLFVSLSGCEPMTPALRMAVSTEEPAPSVAEAMQPVLAATGLEVVVEPDGSLEHIFESVRTGAVDLAVVEEPPGIVPGVMTLAPLYPSVLHVLVRGSDVGDDFGDVLEGKSVYAGPAGGSAVRLLQQLARDAGLTPDDYRLLDNPWSSEPDVFFVFGGLLAADSLRQLDGYRLYSFGEVAELGRGALAEGIVLRNPNLQTFVLPRRIYAGLGEAPVLTLAVPSILVASNELDEDTAYTIAAQLFTHAQEIAVVYPLATRTLNADVDAAALTLPLHPGARRYLERDRPGFLERYAEVMALAATLLIATASGLVALLTRRRRRKKDRVDVYYGMVLELRREANTAQGETLTNVAERIATLQREVFELVIDERIAADESLSVFLALSNQVLAEIDRRRAGKPHGGQAPDRD